jgi:hypothetical protein
MNSKDDDIKKDYVDFIVKMRIFFEELKNFADRTSKIILIVENPICQKQIDSFYEITLDLDSKEHKGTTIDIKNHEKCKICLILIIHMNFFFSFKIDF